MKLDEDQLKLEWVNFEIDIEDIKRDCENITNECVRRHEIRQTHAYLKTNDFTIDIDREELEKLKKDDLIGLLIEQETLLTEAVHEFNYSIDEASLEELEELEQGVLKIPDKLDTCINNFKRLIF